MRCTKHISLLLSSAVFCAVVIYGLVAISPRSYLSTLRRGSQPMEWRATRGVLRQFKVDRVSPTRVHCAEKYSEEGLAHMMRRFLHHAHADARPPRIYFVALLHQNVLVMHSFLRAVIAFVERAGKDRIFLSIIESGSNDGTRELVEALGRDLSRLGIPHIISTGRQLVEPVFADNNPDSGYRIEFLAKLRNAAMEPLYKMGAKNFWKVVAVNDVHLCDGDLWRIAAFNADLSCGLDFFGGSIYDMWVYDGQRDNNCMHPASTECTQELPMQVKCCFNGMASIKAAVFEAGVRWRWGHADDVLDCPASECSLLCRDMKRAGFGLVVVDPTVQVTYLAADLRTRRRLPSEAAQFDDRESYRPTPAEQSLDLWWCCPLVGDGVRYVNFDLCYSQNLSAALGFVLPLPYGDGLNFGVPYEVHWLPEGWKSPWEKPPTVHWLPEEWKSPFEKPPAARLLRSPEDRGPAVRTAPELPLPEA